MIDLCHLRNVNTLLTANKWLSVLYGKLVWAVEIDDMTYLNPVFITEWLTSLKINFYNVTAVYQRPWGRNSEFYQSTYVHISIK